ncbi:NADPH-dependent diflavin oxidoreductase 1 [Pseudohyphozyma bogoriensis]|nr:NADPH-dependent diflavin oxidoreductase 1 [Pseudohyphozyma bogoriensis]
MGKKRAGSPVDGQRPPPRPTLSPDWQAEDADVELLSNDIVRYLVHQSNPSSGSKTFADTFASSSSSSNQILPDSRLPMLELQESSKVLDRIIPFLYPTRSPEWNVKLPEDIDALAALDKYELHLERFGVCENCSK